jgi:hypothetical protein
LVKKSVSTIAQLVKVLSDAKLDQTFIKEVKKVVLDNYGAQRPKLQEIGEVHEEEEGKEEENAP